MNTVHIKNDGGSPLTTKRITNVEALFYAMPWTAYAFVMLPLGVVLPTFYAENTMATMAAIGVVSGLFRIFDAFTDPLIGYLSDRTKSRFGPRKPWVIVGSVVSCGAIFFLFQPPPEAGIWYYAVCSFALFLGYTLFDIPHRAWGSEVAADYDDRSRISTYVSIFTVVGSFLFWVMPLLLVDLTGTTEITGDAFSAIAWLFIILLPISALLAARYVPQGPRMALQDTNLRRLFRSIKRNKPLWRYVLASAIWGIGQGVYLSVIFIFIRDYMQLGQFFAVLMIIFFAVQFVAMPIWMKIMYRYGKHRAWAFSWAFGALFNPVILLVEPGAGSFWLVVPLICVSAFTNAASYIAPRALLGDVIDYDILIGKANNSGNYFAFNTFLDKSLFGIGVAIAFPLLALFGYQLGGPNDATANVGLLLCYMGIPAVTHVTAAALLWNFPIDARRHGIIRKRIEQRALRAERDEPSFAGASGL